MFGRDEFAVQASCQIDPLWNVSVLVLWNMNNGSAIFAPGLPREFLPAEPENDLPDSIGFVSLSWYF